MLNVDEIFDLVASVSKVSRHLEEDRLVEQTWGPGSLRRSSSVDSTMALTDSYSKTQLSRWPLQEDTKKLKHQNELEVSVSEMTTGNHIAFLYNINTCL